jgi:hypothetical protein
MTTTTNQERDEAMRETDREALVHAHDIVHVKARRAREDGALMKAEKLERTAEILQRLLTAKPRKH